MSALRPDQPDRQAVPNSRAEPLPGTVRVPVVRHSVAGAPAMQACAPFSGDVFDDVIDEQPVALVYNGLSHVVMMATPLDLADFALGFSLSEGLLQSPDELRDLTIEPGPLGVA